MCIWGAALWMPDSAGCSLPDTQRGCGAGLVFVGCPGAFAQLQRHCDHPSWSCRAAARCDFISATGPGHIECPCQAQSLNEAVFQSPEHSRSNRWVHSRPRIKRIRLQYPKSSKSILPNEIRPNQQVSGPLQTCLLTHAWGTTSLSL